MCLGLKEMSTIDIESDLLLYREWATEGAAEESSRKFWSVKAEKWEAELKRRAEAGDY